MGVNHRAEREVGALSDPLLQFLDTVERHRRVVFFVIMSYNFVK